MIAVPFVHMYTRKLLGFDGWTTGLYIIVGAWIVAGMYLIHALSSLALPSHMPRPAVMLVAVKAVEFLCLWLAVAVIPDYAARNLESMPSPVLGFLSPDSAISAGYTVGYVGLTVAGTAWVIWLALVYGFSSSSSGAAAARPPLGSPLSDAPAPSALLPGEHTS